MPLYEVNHCIPLSQAQKQALADFITDLHATKFVTPRLFVNVAFDQPAAKGEIFAGAKSRGQTVPKHIRATVRIGPTRSKEAYDDVAVKISKRWDEVVNDGALGAQPLDHLPAKQQMLAKRLQAIVFTPMVAALEAGVLTFDSRHQPGGEGTWLKDNVAYFQELVDVHDDDDVREMLEEVHQREDLRQLVQ